MRSGFKILMLFAAMVLATSPCYGRKKGYSLNYDKKEAAKNESGTARGSFMVASQCEDCNNGYTIDQIAFSGYDKPQTSAYETFFITNNTDRHMTGVRLYVEYLTEDGRQLHKQYISLTCDIPPGETRIAQIKSWDKQNSFVFEKSKPSKKGGTPYKVIFDPISYYLRF